MLWCVFSNHRRQTSSPNYSWFIYLFSGQLLIWAPWDQCSWSCVSAGDHTWLLRAGCAFLLHVCEVSDENLILGKLDVDPRANWTSENRKTTWYKNHPVSIGHFVGIQSCSLRFFLPWEAGDDHNDCWRNQRRGFQAARLLSTEQHNSNTSMNSVALMEVGKITSKYRGNSPVDLYCML